MRSFRKSEAGKIDPNKFKKFRDSIKIKKSICDDDIEYHPNRQQNTE